jgi:spore coat protein A, manganese oxidase
MKTYLPLNKSAEITKNKKRTGSRSMTPISLAIGCALFFGAAQSVSAATTFTLSLAPPGPIGAGINTNIAYTATLTETGTTASTGTTTLRSTLPAGMAFVSGGAGTSGFNCTYATASRIVTCTRATSIARNVPVLIPLTLTSTTTGTKSVSVNVSGGGSLLTLLLPVVSNAVSTVISTLPPPAFTLSLAGPANGMIGSPYAYSATVTNAAATASTGTTVVKTTLPAGLTFVSGSSLGGFTCTAATQVVTCNRATPILPNTPDVVTLNVNPTTAGANATSATITGGGSVGTVTSNTVTTTVVARPDVSVTLRTPAPALMLNTMSQMEIRVANVGSVAKAPINVTFTMPANVSAPLKFSRIADTWVCYTTGQVVNCTYSKDLAAGANSRLRIPVTPKVASVLASPFIASVATVVDETNLANNGPVNFAVATAVAAFVPKPAFPLLVGLSPYTYPVLNPGSIPKYAMPLPNPNAPFYKHTPDTTTVVGTDSYNLDIKQVTAQILPPGFPATKVFAYGDPARLDTYSYPAHTIEARSTNISNISGLGKPVKVKYTDSRPSNTLHLAPVDHTIHGAMAGRQMNPWPTVTAGLVTQGIILQDPPTGTFPGVQEPDIRSVAHLHGAQVIDQGSDGYSEAWSSPTGAIGGATTANPTVPFNINPFDYTNNQESTMLWYHDHTLGMTRNNVYSGLAGLYLLRDDNEMAMIANNQLPSGPYEVPLVMQDRMFKLNGDLAYPDIDINTGLGTANDPSANPEFFGDVMVVNGVSWPYLQVEPRKYRFRLLNGSNARFYTLTLNLAGTATTVPFQVIGTEGGLLNAPLTTSTLTMGPAERYDIVVDFSTLLGKNITIRNTANQPFGRKNACPAVGTTTNTGICAPVTVPTVGMADQIMQLRVNIPLNTAVPNAVVPASLRTPIPALVNTNPAALPHQVLLGEKADIYGRVNPILGTPIDGFLDWTNTITENPIAHTVETWEIFNSSVDAHPTHLHDGAFQVLERQPFSAILGANGTLLNICYSATAQVKGNPACPAVTPATPALATENGWKETVIAYPAESYIPPGAIGEIVKGQVTRVRMKFEGIGQFVWHCHIAEHEDHDMMRPMIVH